MVMSLQDSRLFRTVPLRVNYGWLFVLVSQSTLHHIPPSAVYRSFAIPHTHCLNNSPTPLPVCSLPYFTPSPGSCVPCPPRHLGEGEHLHHLPRAKNRKGKRQQENTPQVGLEDPKAPFKRPRTLYSPQTTLWFNDTCVLIIPALASSVRLVRRSFSWLWFLNRS